MENRQDSRLVKWYVMSDECAYAKKGFFEHFLTYTWYKCSSVSVIPVIYLSLSIFLGHGLIKKISWIFNDFEEIFTY